MPAFSDIKEIFGNRRWPEVPSKPAWIDLQEQHLAQDSDVVDAIVLSFKHGRPILIVGPANRGKTFLMRSLGFRMTQESWIVRYLDVQDFRRREAIQEISQAPAELNQPYLFIIEDCHKEVDDAGELLAWASSVALENRSVVFTTRGGSIEELGEPYRSLVDDGNVSLVDYRPTDDFAKNIIRKFCDAIRPMHAQSSFLDPVDEELTDFIQINRIGSDLERLMRFLKTWERDCDSEALAAVSEDRVLQLVWNQYRLDDERKREVLSRLSVMGQYEIETEVDFIEEMGLSTELQELRHRDGLVHINLAAAGHKATLTDPEDCEWVLASVGRFRPRFKDDEYISDTVKRYVKWEAWNSHRFIEAIARRRNPRPLSGIESDQSAISALSRTLAKHSYTTLLHVLEPIGWTSPDLARSLVREPALSRTIIEGARGASAYRLRKTLRLLNRVVNLHDVFANWSPQDWVSTLDSSRLHTLRLLCFDFHHWHLSTALTALASSVSIANLDNLLVSSPGTTLKEVNNFIGNIVRYVSKDTACSLMESLADGDLGGLIEGADTGSVGRFLRVLSEYSPGQALRLVGEYQKTLHSLLKSNEMPDRFWLLWEIYKADPNLATVLTRNDALEYWITGESTIFDLASAGLQSKCGKNVSSSADLSNDTVVEAFRDELRLDRPNVTLMTLALIALRAAWSKDRCEWFVKQVDIDGIRQRIEDLGLASTKAQLSRWCDEFISVV